MIPRRPSHLLGAAWWTASLRTPLVGASAGLMFSGCADVLSQAQPGDTPPAALDEQQSSGWNVGGEGRPLIFPAAQATDVWGTSEWQDALTTLAIRLAPALDRWSPYYGPSLFQSLEAPRNADLRAVVRPIFTPEMSLASRRAEALLALLTEDGGCRNDVAIVVDLPGPEAVAVAEAVAPCLDPVFIFNHWPHPMGVVPAHLTLGAALYFLPSFERERRTRRAGAAPVFVLDRLRLSPYTDDAGQFDNRYGAALPSEATLRAAGIRHLLYVTPDDRWGHAADDINDDLVSIDAAGIDIKILAMTDFAQQPLTDWPVPAACEPLTADTNVEPPFYFGGSLQSQGCFSYWYGWRHPLPSAPGMAAMPPRLAPRCTFRPTPRATFWSTPHMAGAGGRVWQSAFGHTGNGLGRSGSLGRMHFGGSG